MLWSDDETGIVTPGSDKDSLRISNSLFHPPWPPGYPCEATGLTDESILSHRNTHVIHMSTYVSHMDAYEGSWERRDAYGCICDTYVLIWRTYGYIWSRVVNLLVHMRAYEVRMNAYESIWEHMRMECVWMTQIVESGSTHGGVSDSTRGEE